MSHHRGTLRPIQQGSTITHGGNRLLNACPGCGAGRYERCFSVRVLMDPDTGANVGTYPIVKDDPCSVRPVSKQADTEPDIEVEDFLDSLDAEGFSEDS